jgi:hypothetical protein
MPTLFAALFSLTFLLLPFVVSADPPDVKTLMNQVQEVFEPTGPRIRKVIISVNAQAKGKTATVQWTAGQAFDTLPDGKRMLTVLLTPEQWKGYAFLVRERESEPNIVKAYQPPLSTPVPLDAATHFLDTDFILADLGFHKFPGQATLQGEESLNGAKTYKMEQKVTPDSGFPYSRVVTWIATDSLFPLQREYYDLSGKRWKVERFEKSTKDGAESLQVSMQDVIGNSSTALTFTQAKELDDIPDVLFDDLQMPQAVNSPLWQDYIPKPK